MPAPTQAPRQDKIDEIFKIVNNINTTLAVMVAEEKRRDEEIDKLNCVVFGNGKPGLDKDVTSIKEKLETAKKVVWLIVAIFITAGATAFLNVIRSSPLP